MRPAPPRPAPPRPEWSANAWAVCVLSGVALGLLVGKLIDLAIGGPGLVVAFFGWA